jgi:hypothetical protein
MPCSRVGAVFGIDRIKPRRVGWKFSQTAMDAVLGLVGFHEILLVPNIFDPFLDKIYAVIVIVERVELCSFLFGDYKMCSQWHGALLFS